MSGYLLFFYTLSVVALLVAVISLVYSYTEKKKGITTVQRNQNEHDILLKQLQLQSEQFDKTDNFFLHITTKISIIENFIQGLENSISNIETKFFNSLEEFADSILIKLLELSNTSELSKHLQRKKEYLTAKCKAIIKKGVKSESLDDKFLNYLFSDFKSVIMYDTDLLALEHFKSTILNIKNFGNGGSDKVLIDKCNEFIKKQLEGDFAKFFNSNLKKSNKIEINTNGTVVLQDVNIQ